MSVSSEEESSIKVREDTGTYFSHFCQRSYSWTTKVTWSGTMRIEDELQLPYIIMPRLQKVSYVDVWKV